MYSLCEVAGFYLNETFGSFFVSFLCFSLWFKESDVWLPETLFEKSTPFIYMALRFSFFSLL